MAALSQETAPAAWVSALAVDAAGRTLQLKRAFLVSLMSCSLVTLSSPGTQILASEMGRVPAQASVPHPMVGPPLGGHSLGSKARQVLGRPWEHANTVPPSDAEESHVPAADISPSSSGVWGGVG